MAARKTSKKERQRIIRTRLLAMLGIGAVAGALYLDWWLVIGRYSKQASSYAVVFNGPPTSTPSAAPTSTPNPAASPTPTPAPTPLPPSVYINVPFQVQAPNANWDALHEEACEETSLLMVSHFMTSTPIDPATVDNEIKGLVAWEGSNGYAQDITVEQLSQVAKDYYHMPTGRVVTDVSEQSIKQELAHGKPVILPAAGRLLANPYFKKPGPPYHMLVIKGYDDKGFITNDPGIRQGNDFRYTVDNLLQSVHDWNTSNDDILGGKRAFLVFD